MIVHSFEIVINTEFGGFSLDKEMVDWLMENRGWSVTETGSTRDLEHDLAGQDNFYLPTAKHVLHGDTKFRMNQDLIDCVRALQSAKHSKVGYRESSVHDLEVKTIKIHIDVEAYYDGKEQVNFYAQGCE